MTQTRSKQVTFDEFIAWYPESSEHRYELHNGAIIEMPKPTGKHSEVAGLLSGELFLEIRRLLAMAECQKLKKSAIIRQIVDLYFASGSFADGKHRLKKRKAA